MTDPAYTPAVKRLADEVRKLTTGELVALRDALREDFNILPPDIGDREPREPSPEGDSGAAVAGDLYDDPHDTYGEQREHYGPWVGE